MKNSVLKSILVVSLGVLGVSHAFASAPVISNLPNITVGDIEDNIGTDNNLFAFPNALNLDNFVADADTPTTTLLWSFAEGAMPAPLPASPDVQFFQINGKNPLGIGANFGGVTTSTAVAPGANEIRGTGTSGTISIRNVYFSPTAGSPPFATTNPTARGTTATLAAANGKDVRFHVSDGTNVTSRVVSIKTIDNTTSDGLSNVGASALYADTIDGTPTDRWAGQLGGLISGQTAAATFTVAPGEIRINVQPNGSLYRVNGWNNDLAQPSPVKYNQVGTDWLRGKFYIYTGGQSNPSNTQTIPNLRVRLANLFAVNSTVEVFHNQVDFSSARTPGDYRPSTSQSAPSVYRVDFDQIDVPFLVTNGATQGILFGYEAYAALGSTFAAENGFLALTEFRLLKYAAPTLSASTRIKLYDPAAGDFALGTSRVKSEQKFIPGSVVGAFATPDNSSGSAPTVTSGAGGAVLNTAAVASNRIGVAAFDFTGNVADDANQGAKARVESGKQYVVRFHAVSSVASAVQAQTRFRATSVDFNWSSRLEIGDAQAFTSDSNTIAQQSAPGAGAQNPDRNVGDQGGFYNLMLHSPLNRDIRSDVANFATAPLTTLFPLLAAQPGPGVNAASKRDIFVGADVLDTLSGNASIAGGMTVDRIEIHSLDLVAD